MKAYQKISMALGIAQAMLVLLQPGAALAQDRFRYTCVSPDGQSLIIENPAGKSNGFVFRVNPHKTWLSTCLSPDAKTKLSWDSFPQIKGEQSAKDPNDVILHFTSRTLRPECDPDRHPNPMATHIEYDSACFHEIVNDIRINVSNPSEAELTMRNTFNEVSYQGQVECYAGYDGASSQLALKAAERAFDLNCRKATKKASLRTIENGPGEKTLAQQQAAAAASAKAVATKTIE